jgi:DNA primase
MTHGTIEEVKERLNIVDVVSSYVPLKRAGTYYRANCPFHKEKTPSFVVSPNRQFWHCFGCGKGGDVIAFVMEYENLEFKEALKILAERAGVELPKYTAQEASKEEAEDRERRRLLEINDLAAKFYAKILESSQAAAGAREYLRNRKLTSATVREWQIGYAPAEDSNVLETFLEKRAYTEQEAIAAGVRARAQSGRTYDRFFGRITFPIRSYTGDTVGFTARVLDKDAKAAKYINTSETKVYSKGKVIFGLYQAKQAIRAEDCAIVVEGNMDVITAHQAGFKNVVGSSGTAFTPDQLRVLSRLTRNLKFCFDTDAAGVAATRRTLDPALQQGFTVSIVQIVGAKDPDELILKDPAAFADAVKNAPLYMDYFFEKSFAGYDPTSVVQKKTIAAQLIPLLHQLSDPLELAHYVHIMAQRFAVPEKTVYELIQKLRSKEKTVRQPEAKSEFQPAEQPVQTAAMNRSAYLEQKVLGYALFKDACLKVIAEKVAPATFTDLQLKRIYEALSAAPPAANVEGFIASLNHEDSEVARMALFVVESEYSTDGAQSEKSFEREFERTVHELLSHHLKAQMDAVLADMVIADRAKDKDKVAELNQKFQELSTKIRGYSA